MVDTNEDRERRKKRSELARLELWSTRIVCFFFFLELTGSVRYQYLKIFFQGFGETFVRSCFILDGISLLG